MSEPVEVQTQIVPFIPTMPDQNRRQEQALALINSARSIVVSTQEQYTAADESLAKVKAAINEVKDFFRNPEKGPIPKAYATWKSLCASEKSLLDPLEEAETIIKGKMKPYMDEQERLQKEREAEAARIAEAERKRQEALAEENRRKAAEAREQGNDKAAEKYEIKAQMREERAATTPTPIVQPSFEKGKATLKANWVGDLISLDDLIAAAHSGNALARSFLAFDKSKADRQAKASKNAIQVPGVRFWNNPTIAQKR